MRRPMIIDNSNDHGEVYGRDEGGEDKQYDKGEGKYSMVVKYINILISIKKEAPWGFSPLDHG